MPNEILEVLFDLSTGNLDEMLKIIISLYRNYRFDNEHDEAMRLTIQDIQDDVEVEKNARIFFG